MIVSTVIVREENKISRLSGSADWSVHAFADCFEPVLPHLGNPGLLLPPLALPPLQLLCLLGQFPLGDLGPFDILQFLFRQLLEFCLCLLEFLVETADLYLVVL